MASTIIQMVTEAADLIRATDVPATIVGTNDSSRIFRAAANFIGRQLVKAHDWSALWRDEEITLVADDDRYSMPEEIDRLIPDTGFDQTQYRKLRGNTTAREWRILKNQLVTANEFNRFYRVSALSLTADRPEIVIHPAPTTDGDELVIEYISKFFAQEGQSRKGAWTSDSDQPRLDENLFILGIAYRVKQTLQLPYFDEKNDFECALKAEIAADINIGTVGLSALAAGRLRGSNIADGDWTGDA